jgi:uncharacterized membrane protein YhaH (DUF805 family)
MSVLTIIAYFVISVISSTAPIAGYFLYAPLIFISTWIGLATQAKRWHDLNLSGWMVLLNYILAIPTAILFIPTPKMVQLGMEGPSVQRMFATVGASIAVMTLILLIPLGFIAGKPGENRFDSHSER